MPTHRLTGTPKAPAKRLSTLAAYKYHAVLCLSDWHLDESAALQAADQTGLINRFGKAIAIERVGCLIRSMVSVYEKYCVEGEARPALTVWLGGDFITAAIHEDNRTQTWCNPTQAISFAREQIWRVLQAAADLKPSKLDVVCSVGNHERTTPKSSVSMPAGFSLATGLYEHLRERFEGAYRKRLPGSWTPPPDEGPVSYVALSYGKVGRFLHGDAQGLKYNGGVGGLAVPLSRFVGRANSEPGAAGAITFLGHFHTFGWWESARAVSNGSLIGYTGYARSMACGFEYPAQAMAVLSKHANMGPIAVHKLVCG